jgi:hypothetical protein
MSVAQVSAAASYFGLTCNKLENSFGKEYDCFRPLRGGNALGSDDMGGAQC